ncbi:hypothetical protein ACEQPO_29300 [Bacillus sp. SL00103]
MGDLAFMAHAKTVQQKSYFLLAGVFYISLVLDRLRFFFMCFAWWTNLTAFLLSRRHAFLFCLNAAILIACICHRTTPVIEIGQPSMGRVALQIIAILLIAEAFLPLLIEQPIRRLGQTIFLPLGLFGKRDSNNGLRPYKVFLGITAVL